MKLEGMIPDSPTRLRELLLLIFDGRPFLAFAGVDAATATLDIVWRPEAAKDGYRNVYVPLRQDALGEAQRLVEHLLSQIAMGLPPSEPAAEELFGMIERRTAGAVDRPDYDGITPADALAASNSEPGIDKRPADAPPPRPKDVNDLS